MLDPAKNRYRLERKLNVSTHAPLMRALAHAHFTCSARSSPTPPTPRTSATAPCPASRPLLSRTVPAGQPDVVEPELIRDDPGLPRALRRTPWPRQWDARASACSALGVSPEHALYVLPNALAVRLEESGTLLDLLHKWTMRSCLNAQREIWQASMDEIEQVRVVHPKLVEHVGPPCFVRNGLIQPRCTEGAHFCRIPVWRGFPEIERRI